MSDDELTEDPCGAEDTLSGPRFLAFALLFVGMLGGGILVMAVHSIYSILLASMLSYTASVMLYGFARNRNGIQSFLFTCPVVVSQYPRLLKRHALFLVAVVVIVTIGVKILPHSAESLIASSESDVMRFFFVVGVPIIALALTEIMTNRGLLKRAHNDRFGEPPAEDDSDRADTLRAFLSMV